MPMYVTNINIWKQLWHLGLILAHMLRKSAHTIKVTILKGLMLALAARTVQHEGGQAWMVLPHGQRLICRWCRQGRINFKINGVATRLEEMGYMISLWPHDVGKTQYCACGSWAIYWNHFILVNSMGIDRDLCRAIQYLKQACGTSHTFYYLLPFTNQLYA